MQGIRKRQLLHVEDGIQWYLYLMYYLHEPFMPNIKTRGKFQQLLWE